MPSGAHQCLIYSLAMLLDEDVDYLIEELGHDGLKKVWDAEVPYCYNGIHIQEILDICWTRGISLMPIDPEPLIGCAKFPGEGRKVMKDGASRIKEYLMGHPAILIGSTHAAAWDGSIVWDPNGRKYPLEDFSIREAWLLCHHIRQEYF